MKKLSYLFSTFILLAMISCSGSDDSGTMDDPVDPRGYIKATITYDSGETFEFNGIGNVGWHDYDNTGSFFLAIGAEDHEFNYNSYRVAAFTIGLVDLNQAGTYDIDENSPHITNYDHGVSFGNVGSEDFYPLIFDLGSGRLKIDRLDTERSKGSFEFELFLIEEPAGSTRTFDNPQNVQKVTIVGSYDKNVITN